MSETFLNQFTFRIGWRKKESIELFDTEHDIIIKLKAYYEKDGVTPEQEEAYSTYQTKKKELEKELQGALLQYREDAKESFVPTMLVIERSGKLVLFCDDVNDPDNGIVVCFGAQMQIMLQDDYL